MRELKDPHADTNGINGDTSNGQTTVSTSTSSTPTAWSVPGPAAFDFRSTHPRLPPLSTRSPSTLYTLLLLLN